VNSLAAQKYIRVPAVGCSSVYVAFGIAPPRPLRCSMGTTWSCRTARRPGVAVESGQPAVARLGVGHERHPAEPGPRAVASR